MDFFFFLEKMLTTLISRRIFLQSSNQATSRAVMSIQKIIIQKIIIQNHTENNTWGGTDFNSELIDVFMLEMMYLREVS